MVGTLRSVVYGAGAIGSVLGAQLHKTGRMVNLLARPDHASAIEERGLKVSGIVDYTVRIDTSIISSTVKDADIVFLTVKTQDTKRAVEEFAPYLGESTLVVSLQNGVRNSEIISDIIGETRVIPGVVRFPGQ